MEWKIIVGILISSIVCVFQCCLKSATEADKKMEILLENKGKISLRGCM